jgi:DNA repair exonuclease SbcCD ATPase subunit
MFPQCKFLIDAFDSKFRLPGIEGELNELRSKIVDLEAERPELLRFKEKLDAYTRFVGEKRSFTSDRDNINLQLENCRLRINGFESEKEKAVADVARYRRAEEDIRHNSEVDKKLFSNKIEKITAESELKNFHDELTELNRSLGSDQGVLEKISSQLSQLQEVRDYCTAYEHYIQAMGKDGIAYHILTQKLPLINDEINKILANAADFGVMIEHDPEEQSVRLYLQYGEYKPRLLELGSGAEKMLASVAIRTALLSISNLPKTNMFIVDEGFGKLDPKNMESINRMFDYLRTVFDHIIVVSHIDTMKDMVDNVIDITADEEGYAHIEIGGIEK